MVGVLPVVVSKVATGVSVCDLCQYGDDLIEAHVSKFFNTRVIKKIILILTIDQEYVQGI